ncbi:MAG: DUF2232 domain-containing protein [Bacillota bacterium]
MNKKVIDIIKAVSAVVLLTILNIYIPFLSLFVLIVWPIPIVLTMIKYGPKETAIVITIAALINGIFFSPLMGLLAVVGFGFIGFVLGSSINEELKPIKVLVFTILTVFLSQVIILIISTQFLGFDINQIVNESMTAVMGSPQIDELILSQIKSVIKSIIPAILFISSVLVGVVNYYITMWYVNRIGIKKKTFKDIRFWNFPKWIISLGILITLMFSQNTILLNLNIILSFFAFIQGFSVGLYFVNKKGNMFLNILYVFSVFIIPLLPFALILVGLVDMWFDFRKLKIN